MKRKLKTIQKLMEESSVAYFDPQGYLYVRAGVIRPQHSHLFGNYSDYFAPDSGFYEPEPEKKKIYFCRTKEDGIINISLFPSHDPEKCTYLGSITLDQE